MNSTSYFTQIQILDESIPHEQYLLLYSIPNIRWIIANQSLLSIDSHHKVSLHNTSALLQSSTEELLHNFLQHAI